MVLNGFLATLLFLQLSSISGQYEFIDKGPVLAIEPNRVNIGGVWFEYLPGTRDVSEIFEDEVVSAIKPPFQAEITFVYDENSIHPYVKKIKKESQAEEYSPDKTAEK